MCPSILEAYSTLLEVVRFRSVDILVSNVTIVVLRQFSFPGRSIFKSFPEIIRNVEFIFVPW